MAQSGHSNRLPTGAWPIGLNNEAFCGDLESAMVTVVGGPTEGRVTARFLNWLPAPGRNRPVS
jgi:hypothetical protein